MEENEIKVSEIDLKKLKEEFDKELEEEEELNKINEDELNKELNEIKELEKDLPEITEELKKEFQEDFEKEKKKRDFFDDSKLINNSSDKSLSELNEKLRKPSHSINKEDLKEELKKSDLLSLSFDYLKLNLASAEKMKKWALRRLPSGLIIGLVTRPDTLNYRTLKPENGGLFCQRIFGPIKSWKCACNYYKGGIYLDRVCEKCNIEITEARVRRYRMGYINLAYPPIHYWFISGTSNYMVILLRALNPKIKKQQIDEVIYFNQGTQNIDTRNPLFRYTLYPQSELSRKLPVWKFIEDQNKKFRTGSEVIIEALNTIDLNEEIKSLRHRIRTQPLKIKIGKKYILDRPDPSAIRRLRICENFVGTQTSLNSLALSALPILPPNLRPLVEIEESKLVSSDANELYRVLVYRNINAHDALFGDLIMPPIVTNLVKKLVQWGSDCLIDNGRVPQSRVHMMNDRVAKSLTEALEGKQGRFRQTLLGKRVDYSARSVIVVGPGLRLNQCGLPYDIAAKLFMPLLTNILMANVIQRKRRKLKMANLLIKKRTKYVWKLLENLLRKNCVLLNRAPTLHRFGIQAFNPVLILGKAIQLHPLVCTGFNADFDGDQMAVHLPLSQSSQLESESLMRPSNNILSPANGEVILKPSQDMVIGSYYLSLMIKNQEKNIQKYFASEKDALNAFYSKNLDLHETILVKHNLSKQLKVREKDLRIFQSIESLSKEKIQILNILINKKDLTRLYLLTNIGLITAYCLKEDFYILKDLYLETTVGRLVFTDTLDIVLKRLDFTNYEYNE